jgi:plastocyanin
VEIDTMKRTSSELPAYGRTAFIVSIFAFGMLLMASASFAHGPTIELSHGAMKPQLLNLFVGTTVHFSNTVEMPGGHVVADEAGTIESPPLEHPGDGWHYTFESTGRFELFIRQHPEARATIVVVEKPGAQAHSVRRDETRPPRDRDSSH